MEVQARVLEGDPKGPRLGCPGATQAEQIVVKRRRVVLAMRGSEGRGTVVPIATSEDAVNIVCNTGAVIANGSESIIPIERPLPNVPR